MSRLHRHEPALSRRSRLLAPPLVLLCALAYLGSAAHFVLVQHQTCPVHGELVHGNAHGDEGPRGQQLASFTDERIAPTEADESGHRADVHCSHPFLRRGIPLPAGWVVSVSGAVAPGPLLFTDSVLAEPQVAWLHLAPKASPPQV